MFLHSPLNLDLVILWILNFEFVLLLLLMWTAQVCARVGARTLEAFCYFFLMWEPSCYVFLFIHLGDPFGRYGGPFCNFFSILEIFLPCGRLSATFFLHFFHLHKIFCRCPCSLHTISHHIIMQVITVLPYNTVDINYLCFHVK